MPRSKAANIGDLFERGLRAASGKGISDRSLAALGHVEHHRCKRKPGRIFQAAHVLSDQSRVAGVHHAEPRLGVVDEDVVGVALEPDGAGGGIETRFRLFLTHRAGFGGVLETFRHAPDAINDGAGSLGPLGGEFAAGNKQNRQRDQHHEQRAGNRHGGELGSDRVLGNEFQQSFHGDPPPRTCRRSFHGTQ